MPQEIPRLGALFGPNTSQFLFFAHYLACPVIHGGIRRGLQDLVMNDDDDRLSAYTCPGPTRWAAMFGVIEAQTQEQSPPSWHLESQRCCPIEMTQISSK